MFFGASLIQMRILVRGSDPDPDPFSHKGVERTEIRLGNKILAKYYIIKTDDDVPMLKEKNM